MNLSNIRTKINELDEQLLELFDSRIECSKEVAEVKLENKDEVFKPAREKEIYSRYSDDSLGQMHISYFKRIIQISRKYQYSQFIEQNVIDKEFYDWYGDSTVFEHGGRLELTLLVDESGAKGLGMNDILMIAADTTLILESVHNNKAENKICISYIVDDEEESKSEAFILAYMLYKETVHNYLQEEIK